MLILDIIRFTGLAVIMAYAAYLDYKWGEVPNKVWLYVFFGLSLTFIAISLDQALLLPTILSFISTIVISFTLFYIGGWGGADAKAFLTIGACMPVTPFVTQNISFMYPLNVILICSVIAFIASFATNIRKYNRKKSIILFLQKLQVRFLPYVMFALFLALLV